MLIALDVIAIERELAPGDLVRHLLWHKSLGLVVCAAVEQYGVLWSRTDKKIRDLNDEFDRVMMTL